MNSPEIKVKQQSLLARFFSADNRYLPPILVTAILLGGQLSFGLLESFPKTALAIGASIATELILSRFMLGKFAHPVSSYIGGISVGMLMRSPFYWPYALCSMIAITSKYVIRWKGRHLWNPSNLGIVVLLIVAPEFSSTLSVQWGNTFWPMLIVWILGLVITWRVKRIHITLMYVVSFIFFSLLRTQFTGHSFWAEVAPITGPMYQLFIFFMITDPKTTVRSYRGQLFVAFLVAAVEMLFRLGENIHAPYYALTIVGPLAVITEIYMTTRRENKQQVSLQPVAA